MPVQWNHELKQVFLEGNVSEKVESEVRVIALRTDPSYIENEDYFICIKPSGEPAIEWVDETEDVHLSGKTHSVVESDVACYELEQDYWNVELPEEEKDGYIICIVPKRDDEPDELREKFETSEPASANRRG